MTREAAPLMEDEISLTELFLKLWFRRGLIIGITALSVLAGLVVLFATASQIRTPIQHFINLTAIENNAYPNGTAFSVQDIISPPVLADLARRTGFEETEKLQGAVSVSLSAPVSAGIFKKYQAMLDRRGINQTQIDLINKALAEELAEVTGNTVRIMIDYQALGLSKAHGEQLALLLPQSWTEVFVRQFRVLDNTGLQGLAVNAELPLASGLGALEADRILHNLNEGLGLMAEDSRLQSLQTKAGLTPADLRHRIDDFRLIYMPAILSQNAGRSDAMAAFYLDDLALKIDQIDDQLAGLDKTIGEIKEILEKQSQDAPASASGSAGNRSSGQLLDGTAITELRSLITDSALSAYLTGLFDAQRLLIEERAELRAQIKRATSSAPFPEDILAKAQKILDAIIDSYNELLVLAREMHRRNISELHKDLGAPTVMGSRLPEKAPLMLALSLVLGLFASFFLALILPGQGAVRPGRSK